MESRRFFYVQNTASFLHNKALRIARYINSYLGFATEEAFRDMEKNYKNMEDLDEEHQVYFCAQKDPCTKMYRQSSGNIENLYNDAYDRYLKCAVEKRNACLKECDAYSLCKGGCVLKEKNAQYCTEFAQKVSCAAQFLEHEMKSAFVNVENVCIRQLYLSLIAYGFRYTES